MVCVDLVGPFKIRTPDKAHSLLTLTMIDPDTGWFEIVKAKNKSETSIQDLFHNTSLAHYPRLPIQVWHPSSQGNKNIIDLDKNNGNQLWEVAMKTRLKQLKDYETFIGLDSGNDIPTVYQKVHYHMIFDVKYDLRNKSRLVAGGDWTVNYNKDIYSGMVCMDTVRIGFV
jgi:hypothetical protein